MLLTKLSVAALLCTLGGVLAAPAWQKILLTAEAATRKAQCLDGSPGGFFYRPSPHAHETRWVVFMQGGGWCFSPTNCVSRANSTLGSSTHWPDTYSDRYEGSALFATPPFSSFHIVFNMYCDGSSWSSNSEEVVGNVTLHYRGRPLFDAMIDRLFTMGLEDATEILYSGCSAGGLTAYIHMDYFRSRMNPLTRVIGLGDAMYSLVHNDVQGHPRFQDNMKWLYSTMNVSQSVNHACVSALGDSAWQCMFGSVVTRYIETPMLVLQSRYDTWQQKAILSLNCTVTQCTGSNEQLWESYGREMTRLMNETLPARHSVFLTNCPAHCQTGSGGDWAARTVNGITMQSAVVKWYNATITVDPSEYSRLVGRRDIPSCDLKPCPGDKC